MLVNRLKKEKKKYRIHHKKLRTSYLRWFCFRLQKIKDCHWLQREREGRLRRNQNRERESDYKMGLIQTALGGEDLLYQFQNTNSIRIQIIISVQFAKIIQFERP